MDVILFAIDVQRRRDLAGEAREGEILRIKIAEEAEIVARRLGDVVET